jgi:hypothetical protein
MRAGMAGQGRLVRAGVLVALACAAASLTACAVAAATAGEVHRDFAKVLVATQELAGGAWEIRDDPVARSCVSSPGVNGFQVPALRIASGPDSVTPTEIASAVAEQWTTLGYEVTRLQTNGGPAAGPAGGLAGVSDDAPAIAEVQARGGDGEYLIFRASDQAMTIQGESACTAPAVG